MFIRSLLKNHKLATFATSAHLTGLAEGGYANNPSDAGGETFAGVSRKYWPNWPGWDIIDSVKEQTSSVQHLNSALIGNADLTSQIASFYKSNFWDVNSLDQISDQEIANTVYDFGVNHGTIPAAKTLQQVCCDLENAGVLVIDGRIGQHTLDCVNSLPSFLVYNSYNSYRKSYYLTQAQHPGQHQFLTSWLSRLKPYMA